MLKLEFEEPNNGWLPVKLSYGELEKVFVASNVPIDPISQLVDVLDSSIESGGGEVWWHLEPAGYYLSIQAEGEMFRVKLEYSRNSRKENREKVFEFVSEFEQVVVPLWRSLRKFQSYGWGEFFIPVKALELITMKVKSRSKS